MGTTTNTAERRQARRHEWCLSLAVGPTLSSYRARCVWLAGLLSQVCCVATAQTVVVEPSVSARVVATTNAGGSEVTRERGLILELNPEIYVRARSDRLNVDGLFSVTVTQSGLESQANRVLPDGRLDLNAELAKRTLFVDAGVMAGRGPVDPFRARSDIGATNTSSLVTYRLSPFVLHNFTQDLSVLARNEWIVSRGVGDDGASAGLRDAKTTRGLVRVEHRPSPVGVTLEAGTQKTSLDSLDLSVLSSRFVRAIGTLSLSAELQAGVIAGHEYAASSFEELSDSRRGGIVHWRPTDRTDLRAEVEHRIFGTGWSFKLVHREPGIALELLSDRDLVAGPASMGVATTPESLAALLDATLASRIPNANDRAVAVQTLLNSRGLTDNLSRPIEVFSQFARVTQRNTASLIVNGTRNTLTSSAYYTRERSLFAPTTSSVRGGENRQYGAELDVARRLGPDWNGSVGLSRTYLFGLGSSLGFSSKQSAARLDLSHNVSKQFATTMGLRRIIVRSNIAAESSNATAVFAGCKLRF